ncbi:MAG: lysophospholipid acyltransferase family protein [Gemmataceae bacterium]|nr:lysophospholipid acyltransferase family protein [Gemmataceae bacterium]
MAKKPRSRVVDFAVYCAVRLLVCLVQMLSPAAARALARFLAWLAYHVDKRHRLVAKDNIAQAFPGKYTDAEIDALVRGVYRHFCDVLIDIVHLPRKLHVHNWKRHACLVHGERILDAMLSGRPLLIVTGHFGNWEAAGYVLGLVGFRTHAIARPLDNPYVDDFLRRFRERTGQKLLAKHGDFEKMQDILDRGGVIATLADQDAGQRGVFVDFFGRPASTHKAVALMALDQRVPMVVVGAPKLNGRHHIISADVIWPEHFAKSPDAVKVVTQRFTTDLEHLIRLAPEQYFWLHRRWKHQPQPRKRHKSAA